LVEEVSGGLFTEAQAKVFKQVVNKKLQLIWGPPGTGKTHFLATTVVLLAEAHRFAQASPVEVQQVATASSVVAASEKPQAQVDSSPVKNDDIKSESDEKKDESVQEKTEEKKDELVQEKAEEKSPAAKLELEVKKEDTPEKTDLPVEDNSEEKKVVPETTEEKKDEPVQEKSEEKKEVPATVSDSSTEAKDPAVELKSTEFKPKPASAKGRKPKAVAPEENNSLPKGEGQEFKVLVVGFTHSSIDNLINKILDMVSEFDKVKKDKAVDFKLPVARLVKRDADTSDMVSTIEFHVKITLF
jgi:DNA polymerase III gamma/tau subunit